MRHKQNNNINNIVKTIEKGIITGNRLIDELDPDWYMLEDEWVDEEVDYSKLRIVSVIR